jgi:hypothetical protein
VPEEPCQCPDCQRFYREHDRLIRENPSLRQQQELNWAALQAFRTLAGRVLEELQKTHGDDPTERLPPLPPRPTIWRLMTTLPSRTACSRRSAISKTSMPTSFRLKH